MTAVGILMTYATFPFLSLQVSHGASTTRSKNCSTFLVCRVWLILARSWVRQKYRTSGAGGQKPYQNLRGAQVRFLRHLRIFLGAPLPCFAFWRVFMKRNKELQAVSRHLPTGEQERQHLRRNFRQLPVKR